MEGPALRNLPDLPGWNEDRISEAAQALNASCTVIQKMPADEPLSSSDIGSLASDWAEPCSALAALDPADEAGLRAVLDQEFVALAPEAEGTSALVTGYYEPEIAGSRTPDDRYRWPLYRLPAQASAFDRIEIDGGALEGLGLELLWLADPVDAYFLHVQGSGRVRLPDGKIARVGYAGNNGRDYVAIGKPMIEAGLITKENISMQSIRAWLQSHPDQAFDWLHLNPRYIFFRELEGAGPLGALNVPLTPGRSVAVDPEALALGQPLWLNTTWPLDQGKPLQRLVVAQDKGAAIKGGDRIDFFWGAGEEAELMAGHMREAGRYFPIVPRKVGEAWLARRLVAAR